MVCLYGANFGFWCFLLSWSSKLVYAAFGTLPLKHSWLHQCLKFFSRLQQLNDHRLTVCKVTFQADMHMGLGWFVGWKDALREYDIHMPRTLGVLTLSPTVVP